MLDYKHCLSVKQPFASLIVLGKKSIECRVWKTNFRGKIFIHSSKGESKEKLFNVNKNLLNKKIFSLKGFILGSVEIIDCKKIHKESSKQAKFKINKKYWGWILKNHKRIKPIPYKGKLGIFKVKIKKLDK
jgi:hypothetical protein|tara:strand:+ start:1388 stop:1780 length:393 start_codon:yes stop_codon:yes gene_type:complete